MPWRAFQQLLRLDALNFLCGTSKTSITTITVTKYKTFHYSFEVNWHFCTCQLFYRLRLCYPIVLLMYRGGFFVCRCVWLYNPHKHTSLFTHLTVLVTQRRRTVIGMTFLKHVLLYKDVLLHQYYLFIPHHFITWLLCKSSLEEEKTAAKNTSKPGKSCSLRRYQKRTSTA